MLERRWMSEKKEEREKECEAGFCLKLVEWC